MRSSPLGALILQQCALFCSVVSQSFRHGFGYFGIRASEWRASLPEARSDDQRQLLAGS